MNNVTQTTKSKTSFILAVLAGASIAAGGLVLASEQQHMGAVRSAVEAPPATQTSSPAALPTVELQSVTIVGHRLAPDAQREPVELPRVEVVGHAMIQQLLVG